MMVDIQGLLTSTKDAPDLAAAKNDCETHLVPVKVVNRLDTYLHGVLTDLKIIFVSNVLTKSWTKVSKFDQVLQVEYSYLCVPPTSYHPFHEISGVLVDGGMALRKHM